MRCCKTCDFYQEERMTCLRNEEELTEAIIDTMTDEEYEKFVIRKYNDICPRFRQREEVK